MAWRDKPKADRYGDIGAFVGLLVAVIIAQTFAGGGEFWMRIVIYVLGMMAGRFGGRWIGQRQS
ncbi:hypothetical protein VW29_12845 [Devosia limi DSM 17137]|uniref:Uncharacterized protein n=1 Tax=Devosia limi DSM 17137 TaxID=1121477 RepID=A0A0F5LNZ5_9HYPH|nr:hypothetical protein [Devosia limi]KKB83874.1 hypothetical protein VW29_12845 [Devosia limi DSM 17137]SHE44083.1 hypothetical protein SAMN02745223_00383 [Devosia limi DSM 17137]